MSTIKLLTNASASPGLTNKDRLPVTACDIVDMPGLDEASLREVATTTIPDLHERANAFLLARDRSPDPLFKSKGLLAANFRVEDVETVLKGNPGNIKFLRLYLCLNSAGDHVLVMGPIDEEMKPFQSPGAIYAEQCCGYPPHNANFVGDPILGT